MSCAPVQGSDCMSENGDEYFTRQLISIELRIGSRSQGGRDMWVQTCCSTGKARARRAGMRRWPDADSEAAGLAAEAVSSAGAGDAGAGPA